MPKAQARELLWHCIVNDPRWDLQVESRAAYHASLAVEVGLDPSELNPSRLPAAAQDLDHRLVVKVLSDLYAFGVERAGEVLLDHIASGDEYDDAIHAISQSEALLRQLPEVLDTRFDEAGRVDIVRRWRREVPWRDLAQEHRWIAETLAQPQDLRAVVSVPPEPPPMDAPATDLLAHPWSGATPKRVIHRLTTMLRKGERDDLISALESSGPGCWIAFQALTRLDDPGGIPAAESIVRSGSPGRERAEALRYLRSLSGHQTLPSARQWGDAGDDRSVAALMILEHHAEPADQPYLAARLESSWSERDFYAGLCERPREAPRSGDCRSDQVDLRRSRVLVRPMPSGRSPCRGRSHRLFRSIRSGSSLGLRNGHPETRSRRRTRRCRRRGPRSGPETRASRLSARWRPAGRSGSDERQPVALGLWSWST